MCYLYLCSNSRKFYIGDKCAKKHVIASKQGSTDPRAKNTKLPATVLKK